MSTTTTATTKTNNKRKTPPTHEHVEEIEESKGWKSLEDYKAAKKAEIIAAAKQLSADKVLEEVPEAIETCNTKLAIFRQGQDLLKAGVNTYTSDNIVLLLQITIENVRNLTETATNLLEKYQEHDEKAIRSINELLDDTNGLLRKILGTVIFDEILFFAVASSELNKRLKPVVQKPLKSDLYKNKF
jgi:hypothetical protein